MTSWAYILLGMVSILGPLFLFVIGVVCLVTYQHRRDKSRRRANELLTSDLKAQAQAEREAAYQRGVEYGRTFAPAPSDESYREVEGRPRWEILTDD